MAHYVIAVDFNSRGELCTARAIRKYQKPFIDVSILSTSDPVNVWIDSVWITVIDIWIAHNYIEVLNVAGNARYEIEPVIEEFLVSVFSAVNGLTITL